MFKNLVEVIKAKVNESEKGITFINGSKEEKYVTYSKLYKNANIILVKLNQFGISQGDEVVFQVDDTELFITLFWSCIIGKIIPVPVSSGNNDEIQTKIMKILRMLNKPFMICNLEKLNNLKGCFPEHAVMLGETTLILENVEEVKAKEEQTFVESDLVVEPKDIAFIQFSSGSTGDPKGVILTHENLITNIYSIINNSHMGDNDSVLSWMPLTHDMGLIGNHLVPVVGNVNNYIMPTTLFIRHPLLWLEKASQFKATIISSPNFGYRYYLNHYYKKMPNNLDLSSVRLIFNGAEPISKDICDEFMGAMSKLGLKENSMFTVYGLAEASLAVTFPPVGDKVCSVIVARNHLFVGDKVKYIDSVESNGVCFIDVGFPVNNTRVRIVNDNNEILQDHYIGRVEIKGKNVTQGYYNNQSATNSLISNDGWLNTGDLGFTRNGRLVVTGRAKDIIFINGQNFYSYDLERITEKVDGIELGKCVAIGMFNEKQGQDEIIIFVLYKKAKFDDFYNLAIAVKRCITSNTGLKITHVLPVKKIPKTTSGKVKRYQFVKAYKDGEFNSIIKKLDEMANVSNIPKNVAIDYINDLKHEKRRKAIIELIQEQIKMILGFSIGEYDKSLMEMGIDSIKAPELQRLLEDVFDIELPVTLVFDHPTLNKIADYILTKIDNVKISSNTTKEPQKKCSNNFNDSVAIIGIGCRFPGDVDNPDEFWKKLTEGYDAIKEIPKERWDIDKYYDPTGEIPGKMNVRNGGFIKNIDMFDASFFGITPVEAMQMDPQQRLLLEVSWEAMQNAGLNVKKLNGTNTGVFVGISTNDYNNHKEVKNDMSDVEDYALTGNMLSAASGRISYTFGFHGPTMSIDSACSSSLVAVQQAAVGLATRQCDLALAGGVNLILSPMGHIGLTRMKALSPDGKCKTFDDSADGYVRSEGCGVIVLKRLDEALKDRNNIYAVVKGWSINHDGKSSGLTVPNGVAQENLMIRAMKHATVTPDDLDYIEAHGTGTKLGDPQEVNAIANVFTRGGNNKKLLIGSVKTNIGHLESAAGVAGVIKVALSLKNGMIPKQIHLNKLNRFIQWDRIPVEVANEHVRWDNTGKSRIAGISSFGLSGTNAHIILQEAPQIVNDSNALEIPIGVLTLSARNSEILKKMVNDFITFIPHKSENYKDVCYTSNLSRGSEKYRVAVTGNSAKELVLKLKKSLSKDNFYLERKNTNKKIVFMFAGEGSQYWEMGRELFETQPVFSENISFCDQLFKNYIDVSIIELLYSKNNDETKLAQIEYVQPLIFAVEYALLKMWESFGVKPSLVVGHGIGQYVAACAAGILSIENAVKLVSARGKLMQTLHDTGIMAVIMDSEEKTRLRLMKPMVDEFAKIALNISYCNPNIPIVCDSTGKLINDNEMSNPEYWVKHICNSTHFYDAVKIVESEGYEIFVEIGNCSTLSTIVTKVFKGNVLVLPSVRLGKGNWEQLTNTLCQLYISGIDIDWNSFNEHYNSKITPLPVYPLQRKRYWKKGKHVQFQNKIKNLNKESLGVKKMEKCILEIKQMINEVSGLEVDDIQDDANLFSFGLDSLMLIQVKKLIDRKFKTDLSISRLMDDVDTIEKIANYLANESNALEETISEELVAASNVYHSNVQSQHVSKDKLVSEHTQFPEVPINTLQEVSIPYTYNQNCQQGLTNDLDSFSLEKITAVQLETLYKTFNELTSKQLDALKMLQVPSTLSVPAYASNKQETCENLDQNTKTNNTQNESLNQVVTVAKKKNLPKVNFRAVKLDRDIFTDQQKEFIANFITRYNERTQNSKKYAQNSKHVLSDWIASLNFRMSFKDLIYPIVSSRSQDARFWDIDGNEYIDLAIGYGVHFFGHRPQFVIDAIERQLKEGYETGPQTDLAVEVASLICEITGAERVAFSNTGSEAVMAAMRISRTVTKRNKIVIFRGSYHGNFDSVLAEADESGTFPISPGTMYGMVEDVVILNYGDEEALEKIMEIKNELAAVMVEPIQSRNPGLQPKKFLKKLRQVTTDIGAALIFDEMITGFRILPGGVQTYFDIKADIVTYGKIVGGGMPIGIVAGKSKFIDAVDGGVWSFGDSSYPEKEMTFFAGTFCKHPISLAASRAVLLYIKENGSKVQEKVNEITKYFVNTVNGFFESENVPVRINYFGSQFKFESYGKYNLTLLPAEMDIFFYLLMEKGIYTWEKRICFFSTKHTYEDVEYIINAIKDSIAEMRDGGFHFQDMSKVVGKKKLNFQIKHM